jgi:hypothetical protein
MTWNDSGVTFRNKPKPLGLSRISFRISARQRSRGLKIPTFVVFFTLSMASIIIFEAFASLFLFSEFSFNSSACSFELFACWRV